MKFQKDCKITLTNFILRLNKRNFNAFYSFPGKAILYRKNGFCNISNGYMTATTSIAILLGQLQNESWATALFCLEVNALPNPHFDITITQRSKGQSAVADAAYQSGEKLFSEYDQKTKNYSGKRGILYTEIMLPSHAPPEYANRETLWNSVEAAEK